MHARIACWRLHGPGTQMCSPSAGRRAGLIQAAAAQPYTPHVPLPPALLHPALRCARKRWRKRLCMPGWYCARVRRAEFFAPCRTNKYPREIPQLPWYRTTVPQMLMAGFLPFSAIYVELYYIFASVWGHKVRAMQRGCIWRALHTDWCLHCSSAAQPGSAY